MRTAPALTLLLLAALAAGGCAARAPDRIDATLPEPPRVVPIRAPLDVLTAAASSRDPSLAGRALELLIRTSPEAGGGAWGGRTLWDPHPWVQRSGVEALEARLPEARAVELLEAYVQRDGIDPYVRSRAALALARRGHTNHAAVMSRAWRSQDRPWLRAPLALSAAVLGDHEAVAVLADALAHGHVALEVDFLLDVAHSGLSDLVPALRRGLDRVEPEMRLPYAVALLQLGDPSGEGALRKALADPDAQVRLEVLDYLTRLEHPTATTLLKRASNQGPEAVRWYATLALHARGADRPEVFEQASEHPDREVRALAARLVAEALDRADPADAKRLVRVARKVVRTGLADPDLVVRTEALRALPVVGLPGEEALVRSHLGDDYDSVRVEAAGALLLSRRDAGPRLLRGG